MHINYNVNYICIYINILYFQREWTLRLLTAIIINSQIKKTIFNFTNLYKYE